MRGEYLRAGDAPSLPLARRAGLEIGHRGARLGLGHAHRDHRLAGKQALEIALLVRGRAILGGHAERAEISRLHHVRAARADARHGLDGEHRIEERAALPAVRLGDGDAEQRLLRHEARDVPRIARRMGALARPGGEMFLGEAAHRAAKLLLLAREPKVHLHSLSAMSASTATTPSRFTISGFASASRTGRPGISARRESVATARASASISPRGRLR